MPYELLVPVIIPPVHTGCEVIPSQQNCTVKDGGYNPQSFCTKMHFEVQLRLNMRLQQSARSSLYLPNLQFLWCKIPSLRVIEQCLLDTY